MRNLSRHFEDELKQSYLSHNISFNIGGLFVGAANNIFSFLDTLLTDGQTDEQLNSQSASRTILEVRRIASKIVMYT